MSPRPDVSEERKNQILDAATKVFTQKGFDEARMDDIVDETGLSKGTLYWYFKSKDEIIIAILDRLFQRELGQLESLQTSEMSATDAIWQFTESVLRDLKWMLRMMPIAYEFMAMAFRNRLVQEVIKKYFNNYMAILTPIVQRGIDSGEFRQVDAQEVALAMGAIIEGTLLLWVYDKSLVQPEKQIRSSMKLLLEGVQAQP